MDLAHVLIHFPITMGFPQGQKMDTVRTHDILVILKKSLGSDWFLTSDLLVYEQSKRAQVFGHTSSTRQRSVMPSSTTYTFKYFISRSVLNIVLPVLVTVFYLAIVNVYLIRSTTNGIVPNYRLHPKFMFYSWVILSIFILDWAKAAIAAFEASALMKPRLAPWNALQFMWHTDRAWASLGGWWRAIIEVYIYFRHKISRKSEDHDWKGPAPLWFYLAINSFLLYLAIPLAGLSMDTKGAFRLSDTNIIILGSNQSTFNTRVSNAIAQTANSRWRQGNPTTPQGETILYAPAGTRNVSDTYFEDAIENMYQERETNVFSSSSSISFFSGPEVIERAYGMAWGIETKLMCSIVHPYTDLDLLKVHSINDWTALRVVQSDAYEEQISFYPFLFDNQTSFGVTYQYLIASTGDITNSGESKYINLNELPRLGSLELVMWQSYHFPYSPDPTFHNMSSDPLVVSSVSTIDNQTYLGYAIKCSVDTSVGTASLSAVDNTYSSFIAIPADRAPAAELGSLDVAGYPGILSLETLAFAAFTSLILEIVGPYSCDEAVPLCNAWIGANYATNGVPLLHTSGPATGNLVYPTISPARMQLAIHKLLGEVSIALMAQGPGSWIGALQGLTPATELITGVVPWQIPTALLVLWAVITTVPACFTVLERRWAATLNGREMFRFGAEWRDVTWRGEQALKDVPGMVGDMEPVKKKGFVGLSRTPLRRGGRKYGLDRSSLS